MARTKMSALEAQYYDAFRRLGSHVQFNIMDLGKVKDESLLAVKNTEHPVSMEQAVSYAIAKYRKN